MLTVLSDKQDECKVDELLPVLEFYSKGENTTYCIGFTEIASPELIGKIRNAFLEISEEEKMGFLLANANNNPDVSNKNRLIKIIILSISFLIVICGFLAVIGVKRKKHSNQDSMIDELTGIGNAEYYNYAFEQLLSRQSKNLYAVVYLAYKVEKISIECGEKTIKEIESYAAAHLNSKIASAEYLARINDGVFVMLIQAPTEKECASKMFEIVDSLTQLLTKSLFVVECSFQPLLQLSLAIQ